MSRCNMGWVAFFLTRATGERDGEPTGEPRGQRQVHRCTKTRPRGLGRLGTEGRDPGANWGGRSTASCDRSASFI